MLSTAILHGTLRVIAKKKDIPVTFSSHFENFQMIGEQTFNLTFPLNFRINMKMS